MSSIIIKIEIQEELEDELIHNNISKSEFSEWLGEANENILDDIESTIEDILGWKGDYYE